MQFSKNYTVYTIELLSIIQEKEDVYTYRFSKPIDLTWGEGAHTHLALDKFNESTGWWDKPDVRHFTIKSLVAEGVVDITTRIQALHSDFKETLFKSRSGDRFYLFKVGTRLSLDRSGKDLTIISQGVAQATARPMIKAFEADPENIRSLYALSIDRSEPYLFEDELLAVEQGHANFNMDYVRSRDVLYGKLDVRVKELDGSGKYYVIGSDSFIEEVYDSLIENGVSCTEIIIDKKQEFYDYLEMRDGQAVS